MYQNPKTQTKNVKIKALPGISRTSDHHHWIPNPILTKKRARVTPLIVLQIKIENISTWKERYHITMWRHTTPHPIHSAFSEIIIQWWKESTITSASIPIHPSCIHPKIKFSEMSKYYEGVEMSTIIFYPYTVFFIFLSCGNMHIVTTTEIFYISVFIFLSCGNLHILTTRDVVS